MIPLKPRCGESPSPRTPTQRALIQANRDNVFALSLALGAVPGGAIGGEPDVQWACTGSPVLNRIFGAQFPPENVAGRVTAITAMAKSWRGNVTWIMDPGTTPADLGEHLLKNGWAESPAWIGMAMRADAPIPEVPIPEGLKVARVTDQESLRQCMGIFSGLTPQHLVDVMVDVFCGLGCNESSPWSYYTAFLHDRPVARSMLFTAEGVAGLYWLATDSEVRRRGIGAALTRHTLLQARQAGCHLHVLQATEMAASMYRRLGFEPHCRFNIFSLRKSQPVRSSLLA